MSETIELEIERILPGGVGLAHAENRTFFVTLAAPGDRLRVRVDRTQGNLSFASIVEIISPSPVRIEPPCPYFGRCGGLAFQHPEFAAPMKSKALPIPDVIHPHNQNRKAPAIHDTPSS